jgi:C1A family cysteine protease
MKSPAFNLQPFKAVLLSSLILFSVSCKKDEDDTNPNNNNKSTGWFGSDNTNTIPTNLNNPFEADPSSLPSSVDLSQFFPPVGDQGQYGTCVAWAAGYNAKTALEAIKFGLTPQQLASSNYQLSAKYLFTAIANAKKGENCNGTDFVPALDVMLNKGIATKSTVPYSDLGNCSESSLNTSWDSDAAKHKIKFYRKIDFTITAVKQALAARMPVILGAKLDDSFMQWNTETVYQNHTSFDNVGIHSYHAMCIVGYDNTKGPRGAFKVVNSWSPNWGASGFIWVDYNFMVNGFAFNNNLYVATNDDQKPNPSDPDPVVNPSGVDVVPWVYDDYSETQSGAFPTGREMEFDIFNIGTTPAQASTKWGYAFLYYNAYNANDYGVIFYDEFDPTAPAGSYNVRTGGTYKGLQINVNIPSNGSFAENFETGSASLYRSYSMPATLNGEYYLVLVADATDKFVENDESNNLFYTTDQFPKSFVNGVGTRSVAGQPDRFVNKLSKAQIFTPQAWEYRTAVKPHNRNAYTPEEIIGFLKKEARNGGLAKKIARSAANPSHLTGAIRARK